MPFPNPNLFFTIFVQALSSHVPTKSINLVSKDAAPLFDQVGTHPTMLEVAVNSQGVAQDAYYISENTNQSSGRHSDVSSENASALDEPLVPLMDMVTTSDRDAAYEEATQTINQGLCIALVAPVAAALLALLVEVCCPRFSLPDNQSPLWLTVFTLATYLLLIPGLVVMLFYVSIKVEILGLALSITSEDGVPGPIEESMITFISLMWETGSHAGGILITFYAIVVPAAKLMLLALTELWRESSSSMLRDGSRRLLYIVQCISKWACPDMFAYILLLHLLRTMGEDLSILNTTGHLDLGFSYFSVFCVYSTLASLAISPPAAAEKEPSARKAPPLLLQYFGEAGVSWTVIILGAFFAVLMGVGICTPCMGLTIDLANTLQENGIDPTGLKPVLSSISDAVATDASVLETAISMMNFALERGEANCVFAFTMLTVFGIAMPVLDMLALILAACQLKWRAASGRTPNEDYAPTKRDTYSLLTNAARNPTDGMALARLFGHLAMLDVLVMGVLVVALAGAAYRSQGIKILVRPGAYVLLAAEVMHYTAFCAVLSSVEYMESFLIVVG